MAALPWASLGDDHKFPKFESGRENVFAEGGDVVLVTMRHFLDLAMQPQTLEQARNLSAVEVTQKAA
ncbi:MAG TPA: hypothetical protein VEX68_23330 [Bryobacteraceae bacterium]|nr:hypothetical protein [Bryobacteraceae bacterium]